MFSGLNKRLKIWLRPFRTLGAFSLLWLATLSLGIAISAIAYTYYKHSAHYYSGLRHGTEGSPPRSRRAPG